MLPTNEQMAAAVRSTVLTMERDSHGGALAGMAYLSAAVGVASRQALLTATPARAFELAQELDRLAGVARRAAFEAQRATGERAVPRRRRAPWKAQEAGHGTPATPSP